MSDLDLKRLQSQFQNYIRFLDDTVASSIVSSERLPARTRLDIYRNAYYARFNEVLEADYPVLAYAIGDDLFYQLSCDYADAYPSRYRSINDFGQHLCDFLRQYDSLFVDQDNRNPALNRQFVVELASFEWALVTAFNSADIAPVIGEKDFASLPAEAWPGLCLTFHPSVQLLPQHWNVIAYWNSVKQRLENNDSDAPQDSEQAILLPQLSPQMQYCLVWRQGLITGFRSLDNPEYVALRGVLKGESFSAMCDIISTALDGAEETPMVAASFLKTWVGSEMLAELRY